MLTKPPCWTDFLPADTRAPRPLARLMLAGRSMHAIFFGLKRAYHGALRISRDALSGEQLTPARFDLMAALDIGTWRERRLRPIGVWQSRLRRILGVAASTLSRMLRSLEQLGLIERTTIDYDTRQRFVRLTDEGFRRVRRAKRAFIDSGCAQLAIDSALGRPWYNEASCLVEVGGFEWGLQRLRDSYRDGASLHYPWHPDD
jgi:DNA-binding MarR family transcriptional regulator